MSDLAQLYATSFAAGAALSAFLFGWLLGSHGWRAALWQAPGTLAMLGLTVFVIWYL